MKNNHQRQNWYQIWGGYLLAALTMAALLWMVGHGNKLYFGADLQFHYNRMLEFHENIAHGQFFPFISTYSANQIGSNVIAMYPPLPAYVGALLFFVLPKVAAIYVLLFLQFMLAYGLTSFAARKMGLTVMEANVVGFLYMTATPLVTESIQQWLLGQAWAMSFMPLVVLGFYRLTQLSRTDQDQRFHFNEAWPSIWPLVIGFTGIIYSHVLSFAIIAAFAAGYTVLLLVLKKERLKIFISLMIAGLWSFILSLAFLLPFLVNSVTNTLFTPHADQQLSTWAAPKVIDIWEEAYEFHSDSIGLVAIMALILGIFLFFQLGKKWQAWLLISVTMVISGTYYLWYYLYRTSLSVIQFPHRVFAIPIFLLTILFVYEMRVVSRTKGQQHFFQGLAMIIAVLMLFTGTRSYWLNNLRQTAQNQDYQPTAARPVLMNPVGTWFVHSNTIDNLAQYWTTYGAFDYLPKKTVATQSLLNHQVVQHDQAMSVDWRSQPNGFVYRGRFEKGELTLPMVGYRAKYVLTDQRGHSLKYHLNKEAQMVVTLTADSNQITVKRKASALEMTAIVLSSLAVVASILFVAWYRKR
ncbi:hypothetical protein PT274_01660 [Leuconostocaceae bacterium ESL0958]|nr:hypothetical protein [Leuconostocaceae bacterium ESL0958]